MSRLADIRYAGQSFELRIPVPAGRYGKAEIASIRERFESEYERTYGHRGSADQTIEIVNLRVRAVRRRTAWNPFENVAANEAGATNGVKRDAFFGRQHGRILTPVIGRGQLTPDPVKGPMIVEDMDGTTVVPPSASAHRDPWGNIVIQELSK